MCASNYTQRLDFYLNLWAPHRLLFYHHVSSNMPHATLIALTMDSQWAKCTARLVIYSVKWINFLFAYYWGPHAKSISYGLVGFRVCAVCSVSVWMWCSCEETVNTYMHACLAWDPHQVRQVTENTTIIHVVWAPFARSATTRAEFADRSQQSLRVGERACTRIMHLMELHPHTVHI